MDRKTKIFFLIIGLSIIGSVAATFYRFMIEKDYVIENQIDCDPSIDRCFVWKCDPASDVEGEKCTGDPEKDTWYYQIARRKAANIPLCNPDGDENCDSWTCSEGEKDCATTFCDDQTKIAQEVDCSDPEQYSLDNPIEKEATCANGDDACVSPSISSDNEVQDMVNQSDATE